MKFFTIFLAALLLEFVPPLTVFPALADDATAKELLLTLKTQISDISSISGQFTQEKKLDFLNDPVISQGEFYFSRPDYLLWEYLEPLPSGLKMEHGQIEAWTGRPDQRVKQPEGLTEAARIAAGQMMLWMNLDPEAIVAAYKVSIIADNPLVLKLTPKRDGAREMIQSLQVEFSPDRRTVRQVILNEPQSVITLTFSLVRTNAPHPSR
ncbi:MAG: outer membrane lipoprotein carrier protein LolA [Deltaproteobacteria bacterium]|nr:outer membrane lipoprotein carrier protein LolA [Deltaproteobacteria bacterium]